ncbi:MAG: DUF445 family protein [Syntrophomonadaceae bacterium]|nr:DUF445 family protein [Syntrophomonadaceae bacterium]
MYQIIAIPIISAFIGYITNVVAIKLLFWPRQPINCLAFELYGLLPKRRKDLASSIGAIVEEELLSLEDIFTQIDTPQVRESLVDKIMEIIKTRVADAVPGFVPGKIAHLVGNSVDRVLRQEAQDIITQVMKASKLYLSEEIKIKSIVEEKINQLDIGQLEDMLRKVSSSELKFIEILGGVLGFLIGIIQITILLLFPF